MKIILILAFCCLLPYNLASSLRRSLRRSSNDQYACCITVFEDIDFEGKSEKFCESVPRLEEWNEKISSFKVNKLCERVELYEDITYNDYTWNGQKLTFGPGDEIRNLKDFCGFYDFGIFGCSTWNDEVSSIWLVKYQEQPRSYRV